MRRQGFRWRHLRRFSGRPSTSTGNTSSLQASRQSYRSHTRNLAIANRSPSASYNIPSGWIRQWINCLNIMSGHCNWLHTLLCSIVDIQSKGNETVSTLKAYSRSSTMSSFVLSPGSLKKNREKWLIFPWRSIKVIGNKCHNSIGRDHFALVVCSNQVSISCRFWDIQCRIMAFSWNLGWLFKVIESGTIR